MNRQRLLPQMIGLILVLLLSTACGTPQSSPSFTSVPPTLTSSPVPPTATNTLPPPTNTNTPVPPTSTHTHTPTFTPTKTFTPLPSPTYTLSPTTESSSCAELNKMPVLPLELAQLTFINKSGFPVSLKMESCDGGNIYYLQVSQGTRTSPSTETFTVFMGYYDLTTFACEGKETKSLLIVDRDVKLTFPSCPLSPPTPSITP